METLIVNLLWLYTHIIFVLSIISSVIFERVYNGDEGIVIIKICSKIASNSTKHLMCTLFQVI